MPTHSASADVGPLPLTDGTVHEPVTSVNVPFCAAYPAQLRELSTVCAAAGRLIITPKAAKLIIERVWIFSFQFLPILIFGYFLFLLMIKYWLRL